MLNRRFEALTLLAAGCLIACEPTQPTSKLDSFAGEPIDVAAMENDIATIMEKCVELKLPVGPKNIEATRTNAKFTMRIHFTKDLDMALFTYTFRFDEKQSAPLF